MNLLHDVDDPLLEETLKKLAMSALESTKTNARIDFGLVSGLSCTANTVLGKTVAFNRSFKPGTTPVLFLFVNPVQANSVVTASHDKTKLTNTAFQVQVNSNVTQNVDVAWVAIGQVVS